MFNHNSLTSQGTIALLLTLCQSAKFRLLERRLAVHVQVHQALIASISQNAKVFSELTSIIFEQLEVVFTPVAKGCSDNLSTFSVGNYLRFLGVSLLFAAIMPFLAFFGRSIDCSLTSTNITSNTVSLACNIFLPGNRN